MAAFLSFNGTIIMRKNKYWSWSPPSSFKRNGPLARVRTTAVFSAWTDHWKKRSSECDCSWRRVHVLMAGCGFRLSRGSGEREKKMWMFSLQLHQTSLKLRRHANTIFNNSNCRHHHSLNEWIVNSAFIKRLAWRWTFPVAEN